MSVINSNLFHCSKIGGRSKGFDLPPRALIICGRMNPEALSTVSRLRMAMARHFGARARHTGKTRQPTSGFHSGGGGPRTARTVPFSGRHPRPSQRFGVATAYFRNLFRIAPATPMRPVPRRAIDDGSGTVGVPPLVPIGPVVPRVGLYTSTPKTNPFALAPKLPAVRPAARIVNERGLGCAP